MDLSLVLTATSPGRQRCFSLAFLTEVRFPGQCSSGTSTVCCGSSVLLSLLLTKYYYRIGFVRIVLYTYSLWLFGCFCCGWCCYLFLWQRWGWCGVGLAVHGPWCRVSCIEFILLSSFGLTQWPCCRLGTQTNYPPNCQQAAIIPSHDFQTKQDHKLIGASHCFLSTVMYNPVVLIGRINRHCQQSINIITSNRGQQCILGIMTIVKKQTIWVYHCYFINC